MSLRGLKVRGLWDHPQPTGGTHKDPQGTHKNLDLTLLLIIVLAQHVNVPPHRSTPRHPSSRASIARWL